MGIVWAQQVAIHGYDPKRDAADDIRQACTEAARSHKRVLVEVGGAWCSWCRYMDKFFDKNAELRKLRDDHFVTVKVNFSPENENSAVLSKYPKIPGYPHLFVLDAAGKLLHSQDTSELEAVETYNPDKVRAFLQKWAAQK